MLFSEIVPNVTSLSRISINRKDEYVFLFEIMIFSNIDIEHGLLFRSIYKGEFWKPCPGTTGGYLCCGYQIITPMRGCAMYCRYCVLQAYFDDMRPVVYDNFDDLKNEIITKMEKWHGIVRFGTGEFTDSLCLEEKTGLSTAIAALLEPWPQAIVEFKTKSTVVKPLEKIKRPDKVIIAFSLNTPRIISLMEQGTASLDERFRAAKRCLEMGFNIAFHFDPIFIYKGWEKEYREVVEMIYDAVGKNIKKLAWCSMGGFRANPGLKKYLKEQMRHLQLFSGEMITGADGKLRYFRPIRVEIYRAMQDAFYKFQADAPLYLCMESHEVWEESGMIGKIPEGLPAFLDQRAEAVLSARAR